MTALGIRFLDKNGNKLSGYGQDLEKIAEIDVSGLNPLVGMRRIYKKLCVM